VPRNFIFTSAFLQAYTLYGIEHSTGGSSPMTPEDLIDELSHNVLLAPDSLELERALGELQSALQDHREYLESVAADYLLSLPLAIRERLNKLHETIAA
jgi:hypothetical protein